MKSAHRHQLETNDLAHRLELFIERCRPYVSTIAGVLVAIAALILIWSYVAGSSAARRSETWDTYNRAISSLPLNVEELHRTAQEYPGTPMQEMADVTWADSQVFVASRNYLVNRQAALDTLAKAMSAYQSVIQTSKDDRLTGRARLGLARIYEMQNQLEKAREQYGQVTGPFAEYAKKQADQLAKPATQETYAWLATAQLPKQAAPMGPGTPGQKPEFSAGDMALPGAASPEAGTTGDSKSSAAAFDELLKSLREDSKKLETPDRYKDGEKTADGSAPADKAAPPTDAKDAAAPPPADKADDKDAAKPADDPATERSTK
jgi:hypothetical protein